MTKIVYPDIKSLRKTLRNTQPNKLTKLAGIGSQQDLPFEQAFSNLAHTLLADRCGELMPYELGFQLVDKNEENSKALGIFAAKVGSQLVYVPLFYLNGNLKGGEFLYLKNQDLFIPNKSGWIALLMNKRPHSIGHKVTRDLSGLGVLSPQLFQLAKSPAKYASDNSRFKGFASWALDVLPDFAHFAVTDPFQDSKYAKLKTALDLVKEAGAEGIQLLTNLIQTYPAIRPHLNTIYGETAVREAVKQAAIKARADASVLNPVPLRYTPSSPASVITGRDKIAAEKKKVRAAIRIISYKKIMEPAATDQAITDKEKEQLQGGDIVIKDEREDKDVTIAYRIDVDQKLQSPDGTGLYEVLTRPGDFRKCLVVRAPYSGNRREPFYTVIDVENKSWLNNHVSKIWVKQKYDIKEFNEWFDKLDKGSMSGYGLKMLLGPTGQGTVPFHTHKEDGGELKSYRVGFRYFARSERGVRLPNRDFDVDPLKENSHHYDCKIIMTEAKGKAIRLTLDGELLVPNGYKVISLDRQDECGCGNDSEPPAILELGTMPDLSARIIKSGNLRQMEIRRSSSYVRINDQSEMTPTDALIYLVKDAGFREKQARELLDIAKEEKLSRFHVKYAAAYDLLDQGPSSPAFPEPTPGPDPLTGGRVPTTGLLEQIIPIPGMSPRDYDRSVYDPRPDMTEQHYTVKASEDHPSPDEGAVDTAMNAASNGQKEVFDTAILGSLLKSVRSSSTIDRFLGDLMKGMDRLARILFIYYWHKDEFEERYGKEHIPEFEDGARNAFEAMGDIVLWLQKKRVDPFPDQIHDVDLKEVAGE